MNESPPPAKLRTIHNDQWTLDIDQLGMKPYAIELARTVLLCQPPFAVCVSARWGSGKTSLMRYAMAYVGGDLDQTRFPGSVDVLTDSALESTDITWDQIRQLGNKSNSDFVALEAIDESSLSKSRVSALWFSAWQYQYEPDVMVCLLQAIRSHFSRLYEAKGFVGRFGEAFSRAALNAAIEGIDGLFGLALGGKDVSIARDTVNHMTHGRPEHRQFLDPTRSEHFRLLFEKSIRGLLFPDRFVPTGNQSTTTPQSVPNTSHPKSRLVIFIDDLDRCESTFAVRMIEMIKLHLSNPHCVFVLGLDEKALEHGVNDYWRSRPPGMAREYIEKLFQKTIRVPVPTKDQLANFVDRLLSGGPCLVDTKGRNRIEIAKAIVEFMPASPRKLKKLVNELLLDLDVRPDLPTDQTSIIARALLIRLRAIAPDTAGIIASNTDALKEFFTFADNREGPDYTPTSHWGYYFGHEFGHFVGTAQASATSINAIEWSERRLRAERIACDRALLKAVSELKDELTAVLNPATP